MEKRLECLLGQDEIYWRQRSQVEWLTHGDKNTNFFHSKASERHKRNKIEGMFNKFEEYVVYEFRRNLEHCL